MFQITDNYLIAKTEKFVFRNKHAIFDLDYTLIKPKSGKKFPINYNDWQFLYSNTKSKLLDYYNDNYSIIIISNQSKIDINDFTRKLTNIIESLSIELIIYVALNKNKYRKPSPNFYYEFIHKEDTESFYCGDAAGRKGDFSNTDYKFALNCNIKFYLPEQIFLLLPKILLPPISYPDLTNKDINSFTNKDINTFTPHKHKKEIIIMTGFPASGKSTIASIIKEKYGYEIINRDTLKTKAKCEKMANEYISKGLSFIIDNTNPDIESRKNYISICKSISKSKRDIKDIEDDYYITSIYMKTSYELSMHNNHYRNNISNILIPDIAYNIYKGKFIMPSLDEGFDRIIPLDFSFIQFDKNYFYYLY